MTDTQDAAERAEYRWLRTFIEETEATHFRTHHDVGANLNALVVWNRLREFAGLPRIDRVDLLGRYVQTTVDDLLYHYHQVGDSARQNQAHYARILNELVAVLTAENVRSALDDYDKKLKALTKREGDDDLSEAREWVRWAWHELDPGRAGQAHEAPPTPQFPDWLRSES